MLEEAMQMHALFRGREDVHGVYKLNGGNKNGKLGGQALTVRQEVTDEKWLKHLEGKIGLGIVPIDQNDLCVWGCIDVDDYQLNFQFLLHEIERLKYPLVLCKSKSGGGHLFVFSTKPLAAKNFQDYLRGAAANLKLAGREIFPKQTQISGEGIGNWLNMPYFGDARHCVTLKEELALEDFIKYSCDRKVGKFPKFEEREIFPDGPPCLQSLYANGGCGPHEKHVTLWNSVVYFKQARPDSWEKDTHQINSDAALFPHGGHDQITDIITDLKKRDYNYICDQPPVTNGHCNRSLCATRLYGFTKGTSACMPVSITTMSDGLTTTNYIKLYSNGELKEVECSTKIMFDPQLFAEACWDQIQDCPTFKGKRAEWIAHMKAVPRMAKETEHHEVDLLSLLQQHYFAYKTEDRSELLTNVKMMFVDNRNQRVLFKLKPVAKLLETTFARLQKLIEHNSGGNGKAVNFRGNIGRKLSWLPLELFTEALPDVADKKSDDEDPI
jgi:hypothetical protein